MPEKEPANKYDKIINILGEERIEKLYLMLGREKFSVATVKNFMKRKKITDSIRKGIPCQRIISLAGASRRTIYRHMKKALKK